MRGLLLALLVGCSHDIETVCTPVASPAADCELISWCGPDPADRAEPNWYDVATYILADEEVFICENALCANAMDDALAFCGL